MSFNRLGYRTVVDATGKKVVCLLIDERPLLDIFEAAIPAGVSRCWTEKPDAVLVRRELTRSLKRTGDFYFYTCRHCRLPEDLDVPPIRVERSPDQVVWRLKPPGAERAYQSYDAVEFRFRSDDYDAVIRSLPSD